MTSCLNQPVDLGLGYGIVVLPEFWFCNIFRYFPLYRTRQRRRRRKQEEEEEKMKTATTTLFVLSLGILQMLQEENEELKVQEKKKKYSNSCKFPQICIKVFTK